MKIHPSGQTLLLAAIVLLVINLVLAFAVHGAMPARAADTTAPAAPTTPPATVIGVACSADGGTVFTAWSNGSVSYKKAGGKWEPW